MRRLIIGMTAALLFNVACNQQEPAAMQIVTQQPAGDGLAVLTAEGTRFEPALEKSRIPDQGWICDMGTVHYARAKQGDGICPLCKMTLVQHSAAADKPTGCECPNCPKEAEGEQGACDEGCECGDGCEGCGKCKGGAHKAEAKHAECDGECKGCKRHADKGDAKKGDMQQSD